MQLELDSTLSDVYFSVPADDQRRLAKVQIDVALDPYSLMPIWTKVRPVGNSDDEPAPSVPSEP